MTRVNMKFTRFKINRRRTALVSSLLPTMVVLLGVRCKTQTLQQEASVKDHRISDRTSETLAGDSAAISGVRLC